MTARRFAIWWRLLLAAGVLLGPVAGATAVVAGGADAAHQTFTGTQVVTAAPMPAAGLQPRAGVQHVRHPHRAAPMLSAVAPAAVLLAVFLISSCVGRRRASQLPVAARHWWSSRAPPAGTSSLVPFGHASGRAGRFSRSRRALFPRTVPVHC